ncbi:sensor histidine kinase [Nitrosopumilus sp.]|uniref:sensor histidine kinase n=1 Tax=Nitrosopumilus sp. TaxID=2024843 RepID=UPI00349FFB50
MRSTQIIALLVVAQIVTISVSFGSLYIIEVQEANSTNHVNIAGKNEMYAALTFHEIDRYNAGITSKIQIDRIFDEYSQNILLLKYGGIFLDDSIKPVPERDMPDLLVVEKKFLELQTLTNNLKEPGVKMTSEYIIKLEQVEAELFDASQTLTEKLTIKSNETIKQKENLGLILPIINAIVYVVTIYTIFQTLKRENRQIQRLEKLYTIGQMASRLAHDLKNPLTVIKSSLDMLEVKYVEKNEFTQTVLDRMKKSIKNITHIIDDVLEYARTKELNVSKSSVLQILNQSVSSISFPETVTIKLPQNDVVIECDNMKLQSIFVNLFTNALYAMENNGEISVKIDETNTGVKISVTDSGSGIPRDILPHVFEPLFTSKPTGTGLGLGICKNIIEQHNGKISVTNNPTTFTIELPKA